MSQHDFNIANQGFPATRADINNAFQAIASNSAGPTAPSTTFANMWWYDTTDDKMYLRNAADSAWIEVAVIDQANNEWKITSGVIQAADGDGFVLKTDDGITRFSLDDTGNITFPEGTDIITGSAGTDNVRIGAGAGDSIASGGDNNVAVGTDALTANTTASDNTAVGYQAGYSNTTGLGNAAFGLSALRNSTTSGYNVAIGERAFGNGTLTVSNAYNTAVGHYSGYELTGSAINNTFLGANAGYLVTSGSNNTILGKYTGNQGGLDIRTSSNNIVLSDGDGNPRVSYLNAFLIGTSAVKITGNAGVGGFAFIQAYNTTGGSQGWWIVAHNSTSGVSVVSSANSTGLTVTFARSGGGLTMQVSSGQLSAQVFGTA